MERQMQFTCQTGNYHLTVTLEQDQIAFHALSDIFGHVLEGHLTKDTLQADIQTTQNYSTIFELVRASANKIMLNEDGTLKLLLPLLIRDMPRVITVPLTHLFVEDAVCDPQFFGGEEQLRALEQLAYGNGNGLSFQGNGYKATDEIEKYVVESDIRSDNLCQTKTIEDNPEEHRKEARPIFKYLEVKRPELKIEEQDHSPLPGIQPATPNRASGRSANKPKKKSDHSVFRKNLPNHLSTPTVNRFKEDFKGDEAASTFIELAFPKGIHSIENFRLLFEAEEYQHWSIGFFGGWDIVRRIMMAGTRDRDKPLSKLGMMKHLDVLERGAITRSINSWTRSDDR